MFLRVPILTIACTIKIHPPPGFPEEGLSTNPFSPRSIEVFALSKNEFRPSGSKKFRRAEVMRVICDRRVGLFFLSVEVKFKPNSTQKIKLQLSSCFLIAGLSGSSHPDPSSW